MIARTRLCRAVFLDRDGVINRPLVRRGKPYPPVDVSSFRIYPEAFDACQLLRSEGFLLVVATNQPDVGRGLQSRDVVEAMHKKMCEALPIDRVEVCYDADAAAASGCHKPASGMLLRAADALGIDVGRSYMVGDRWRDVDCGQAAGCTTVFIDRGYDERLGKAPDFKVYDLLEAAELIKELESGRGPIGKP